jgi:hypothetical protein
MGVTHGKILPGAVLLALLVARPSAGERGANEAAAGAVAAAYTIAGLSKLLGAGGAFLDPGYLGLLVAERSVGVAPWLAELRLSFADSPTTCRAVAAGALALELGGVAFLWPRLRIPYALAITGLHAGIFLLMGYMYASWVAVVWGIALLPRNPRTAAGIDAPTPVS